MEKLKNKLLQVVNESGLPLDAVYYVCKDFFRDVGDTYQQFLLKQQEEENKKQQEEEN